VEEMGRHRQRTKISIQIPDIEIEIRVVDAKNGQIYHRRHSPTYQTGYTQLIFGDTQTHFTRDAWKQATGAAANLPLPSVSVMLSPPQNVPVNARRVN
jgi:hypothetical protein